MRTLLICHDGDQLDRVGLARWLASFSDLVGIVAIRESRTRVARRLRREYRRVGLLRVLDGLAFRLYYRAALARRDRRWIDTRLAELRERFPPVPADTPVHYTATPNSPATEAFIRASAPDIVIARCKFILKESVFSIARRGTFVLHPGICPEYRNAHGCFWALANDDLERVGVTLLRVDRGVDTGPVFAYFGVAYDEVRESHVVIQLRGVFDNLDAIAAKLEDIHVEAAQPIDTGGRRSGAWGQPWLTRYLSWKRRAGRRVR